MQQILQAWLRQQCEAETDSRGTLWMRKGAEAPAELVASHPPGNRFDPDEHRGLAETALASGRAVVRGGDDVDLAAAPGRYAGAAVAAVVEQPKGSPREQAARLDALGRGVRWLEWSQRLSRPAATTLDPDSGTAPHRADRSLELLAIALEPRPVAATTLALATELAALLPCDRVSLGRLERDELVLDAVSHSSQVDGRSRLARDLRNAMQEAIDQDAVVVHPAFEGETPMASSAHRQLADEHGAATIWTFPLRDDDALTGAMLVEFGAGRPPNPEARVWLEQLASLLAPVLGLQRRDQSSFGQKLAQLLREDLPEALGLDRLNVRLAIVIALIVVLALGLLPATHRISAPAQLEGIVQRAIVAPMPAFVAESRRRAGDIVKKGEVLGVLEDAELRLEARKWAAKREQRRKELRAAMAERDRSQVRILQAQVEQAEAELELITEQRRRTRLVAPFAGVVTHGDLSQLLGSPVERGEVLFEVAPQNDYRVILEVDGRDIAFVQPGQEGRLTLQALPGAAQPFRVRRVTPISSAADGRSFFRVEAALHGDLDGLRPGMDGVAKIDIGSRSLLWIWTHSALDWLRMAWWAWVP